MMTDLPVDDLELSVLLCQELEGKQRAGRQISGRVPDHINFDDVVDRLADKGLTTYDQSARKVDFLLHSGFFFSLDEVIEHRGTKGAKRFYLADQRCYASAGSDSNPQELRQYFDAIALYKLLSSMADHTDGAEGSQTLIFLHKEKFSIEPSWSRSDLRSLEGLDRFKCDFVESPLHVEQKRTIVKSVLLEIFQGRKRVDFGEVLRNFSGLLERIVGSYQLYVAEFSFQKVKGEIEKEKLEATIRLNKVFSDIQNQLLVIPAALALAGSQLAQAGEWTTKNSLIAAAVFAFAILMSLLVRNQQHTLNAVKSEIDLQRSNLRDKHRAVAKRFDSTYEDLDKRHIHQERLIHIVDALVGVTLGVTAWLLVVYSTSQAQACEAFRYGVAAGVLSWFIAWWMEKNADKPSKVTSPS